MAMPTEVTSCDSRGWARGIRQLIVAINVAEKRETKKKKKRLVSEHWIRGERERRKKERIIEKRMVLLRLFRGDTTQY